MAARLALCLLLSLPRLPVALSRVVEEQPGRRQLSVAEGQWANPELAHGSERQRGQILRTATGLAQVASGSSARWALGGQGVDQRQEPGAGSAKDMMEEGLSTEEQRERLRNATKKEKEHLQDVRERLRGIKAEDVKEALRRGDLSKLRAGSRLRRIIEDLKRLPESIEATMTDNARAIQILTPGLKPRESLVTLPWMVSIGLVWIVYWVANVYQRDHEDYLVENTRSRRSKGRLQTWQTTDSARQMYAFEGTTKAHIVHSDVVFVFHHPNFERSDLDKQVSVDTMRRIIANSHHEAQVGGFFQAFESAIEEHESARRRLSGATARAREALRSAIGLQEAKLTMREARIRVLKDMVRSLPLLGLQVKLFRSCGNDQIFLCVSLNHPESQRQYLWRESVSLQTTHQVIRNLHIEQDPLDPRSSPPIIMYDPRLAHALYKAGVLPEDSDLELYQTYHDRDSEGSIMSSRERVRIIQREVTLFLDIEAAKEVGILEDCYPAHSELWLRKLRSTWTSRKNMKDFSFSQPVCLLRDYYGTQLAFSFAWQGVWCKGLICLSVLALLDALIKTAPRALGFYQPGEEPVKERQFMPFAILTLIWARVVTNLWLREEDYFLKLWNQDGGIEDRIVRPAFKGKMVQSDVDASIWEAKAPTKMQILRQVSSVLVTLVCCMFTMAVIGAWVHLHEGDLDIPASMCLSALVKMFEFLYNMLAARLIRFENHKYDQEFHDRWVWIQFLFQAVNSYWACVAVAFTQFSGRCPEIGCFVSLKYQIGLLLVILLVCGVAFDILEYLLVCLRTKTNGRSSPQKEGEAAAPTRSFLEEQSKYSVYGMREQVENMLQLVLGLGFVLLFGMIAPMIVPLCLAHMTFALRSRTWLLTEYSKRSLPHKLMGIGAWKEVMQVLMNLGVFVNGVLIVCWGRFFQDSLLLAKLSGFAVWIMLIYTVWSMVDLFLPPVSQDADIMAQRRKYSASIIRETSMDVVVEPETAVPGSGAVGDETVDSGDADGDPVSPGGFSRRSGSSTLSLLKRDRRAQHSSRRSHGDAWQQNTTKLADRASHMHLERSKGELAEQADIVAAERWDDIPTTMLPAATRAQGHPDEP